MTDYRCIRCGKAMKINSGDEIGTCNHCGTEQVLPLITNDNVAKSYIIANNYFIENEYEKAEGNYEPLAKENQSDPFPQWMLMLCRYGVQYCKSDESSEWKLNIQRFQERRVLNDSYYDCAINLANNKQKSLFMQEAKELEGMRARIETISFKEMKEMPVDVFISYKEKDASENKTDDSAWAETLYYDLMRQGLRVFYAPVSLKGKVGEFFESYIYAAIHSAKVMIVLGTKKEYFESPWIRNEWSRFLALVKESKDKKLITVYRNMKQSELPEKLSSLQAIEMSGEWLKTVEDQVAATLSVTSMQLPRILKRGFEFLKEGNSSSANGQFEKMLDTDDASATAYAMAYVGKLMIELHVKSLQELQALNEPFNDHKYYKKAMNEKSSQTTQMLEDYTRRIEERKEYNRKLNIYNEAKEMMDSAKTEDEFRKAAMRFAEIPGFQDASKMKEECLDRVKDIIYHLAKDKMMENTFDGYEDAIKIFNQIREWSDSLKQAENCRKAIDQLKVKTYAKAKEAFLAATTSQQYESASILLETIKGYKEADLLAEVCRNAAKKANEHEIFINVMYNLFYDNQKGYADSLQRLETISGWRNVESVERFYEWLKVQNYEIRFGERIKKIANAKIGEIVQFGRYFQDKNGMEKTTIDWRVLAREKNRLLLIGERVLECKRYNETDKNITWQHCTLKRWLNEFFIKEAFNNEEMKLIVGNNTQIDETVMNDLNRVMNTDKVFLLTIEEAKKYFASDKDRGCKATEYAENKNVKIDENNNCPWFLCSSGIFSSDVAIVHGNGSIDTFGYAVSDDGVGVRPALWVILNFAPVN